MCERRMVQEKREHYHMINIPWAYCKNLGIKKGDMLEIDLERGSLVMRKVNLKR